MNENEALVKTAKTLVLSQLVLGWGMVFTYVIFNSVGAFLIKSQIQKLGPWNFTSFKSVLSFFVAFFSSWVTWLALFSVGTATIAWIIALTNLEISKAYPVAIGTNLLVLLGVSLFKFQEPFTLTKALGASLIFAGIVILVR